MPNANLLNAPAFPLTQPIFFGQMGPYTSTAGNLYWVLTELITNSSSPLTLVVYKSSDGGTTFSRIPAPNPSTYQVSSNNKLCANVGSSNTIHVGWQDPNKNLQTATFTMDTDSWSAINSTGNTTNNTSSTHEIFINEFSGGNVLLSVAANVNAGGFNVWGMIFNGSSWASPFKINGGTTATDLDFCIPIGGGNIGAFWEDGTNIYFTTVTPTGTVTTVTAVANNTTTVGAFNFPASFPYSGLYDSSSDTVAVVGYLHETSPFDVHIGLLSGTPTTSTPTWTTTSVADDATNNNGWDQIGITKVSGGFEIIVNPSVTDGATTGQLQSFSATSITGTWSGPVTFYDAALNPVGTPPVTYEFVPIFVTSVATAPVVTFGLLYTVSSTMFCGVMAFIPSAPSSSDQFSTGVIFGESFTLLNSISCRVPSRVP